MTGSELPSWSKYQEDVADFFGVLGLRAATNVAVVGVRTSHDIDVVVNAHFAGVDLFWVVECKQMKRAVTKIQVLAFRTIVEDTGADRGFMMAENGYQSGAVEAAALSNITLTSLGELNIAAGGHLAAYRIEAIGRRLDRCSERLSALHVTTHRSSSSWRTRSLSGAGETTRLMGKTSVAESALKRARFNRLPAVYGFMEDGNTRLVAHTMPELLEALERIADDLDADLADREKHVSAGADAHLWRAHNK